MKRVKIIAGALALAATLAACGGSGSTPAPETVTVAPPTTTAPAVSTEDAVRAVLADNGLEFNGSDADLAGLGAAVCDVWDSVGVNDASLVAVANTIVESAGITFGEAGTVIGAVTAAYCPEYVGEFTAGATTEGTMQ